MNCIYRKWYIQSSKAVCLKHGIRNAGIRKEVESGMRNHFKTN